MQLRVGAWMASLAGSLLVVPSASAAPPRQGVRLDPLQPASPESSFVRAEGLYAGEKGRFDYVLGASLEYASSPLRVVGVDADGGETEVARVVSHLALARFAAALMPTPWLRLEASLPFSVYQGGELDRPRFYSANAVLPTEHRGLGDLRLGAHVRVVDSDDLDVLVGARYWLPIGSEGAYLSDARARVEIDLGVAWQTGKRLQGCTAHVAPGIFAERDGDRVALGCALHLRALDELSFGVEPSLVLAVDERPDEEIAILSAVEALAAVRLSVGGVRVGLAGGPVLGSMAGAGDFRGMFSLAYVGGTHPIPPPRRPGDRDFDGILDGDDACPDEAGPDSTDAATRGCPATDTDGDGIPDAVDACPDRPGLRHDEPRANGCPDGDNDGLLDPIDECPLEPGSLPSGCPRFARIEGASFRITPDIAFRQAELTPESRAAFEEIASTVRANPRLPQLSIALGTRGVTVQVTDRRAQAILAIFQKRKLDASRYELVLRDDLKAGSVTVRILR